MQIDTISYLELEQSGGVLEDDCLDVAANLDGVDGDAGDEVEEDVVAVRPVGQWVRERHLALKMVTLHAHHHYGRFVFKWSLVSHFKLKVKNLELVKSLQQKSFSFIFHILEGGGCRDQVRVPDCGCLLGGGGWWMVDGG